MDSDPDTVVSVIKEMRATGKGIIGMKILGQGAMRDRQDEALNFALSSESAGRVSPSALKAKLNKKTSFAASLPHKKIFSWHVIPSGARDLLLNLRFTRRMTARVAYVSNPINRINSSALLFSTTPSRNL